MVRTLSSGNEVENENPEDEVLVEAEALESDSDSLDDEVYREYDHFSTSSSDEDYGQVSQDLP